MTGQIASDRFKVQATQLVSSVPGVQRVDNQLLVPGAPSWAPTWEAPGTGASPWSESSAPLAGGETEDPDEAYFLDDDDDEDDDGYDEGDEDDLDDDLEDDFEDERDDDDDEDEL